MHLFGKDAGFEAFQRVMIEAHRRHPIRILSYCVLSNHWHFAVWPDADGQVTAFFRWLAHTHAIRWRIAQRTVGTVICVRDGSRASRCRATNIC
jgi:putative transposase